MCRGVGTGANEPYSENRQLAILIRTTFVNNELQLYAYIEWLFAWKNDRAEVLAQGSELPVYCRRPLSFLGKCNSPVENKEEVLVDLPLLHSATGFVRLRDLRVGAPFQAATCEMRREVSATNHPDVSILRSSVVHMWLTGMYCGT